MTTGVSVLQKAIEVPGINLFSSPDSDTVVSSYGVVTTGKYDLKAVATDVFKIAPAPKGFVSNFAYEISKHRCYERELDGLTDVVAY
jgi:catalase